MKLVIVLAVCAALVYGRIPNGNFPKCDREGPEKVKCIKSNLELFRKYLKEGIPVVNIPRLEPFKMKQIEIDAEMPSLVLKGEATSIVAYGASEFKIIDLKVDLDTHVIEVTILIPKLVVSADYEIHNSQVYMVTINGSGQFKGTFTDVTVQLKSKGHGVNQNGLTYSKIDDLTAHINFGGANIRVDPDNAGITEKTALGLVNNISAETLNLMSPVIDKAAAPIIKKHLAKILDTVPLEDLFNI